MDENSHHFPDLVLTRCAFLAEFIGFLAQTAQTEPPFGQAHLSTPGDLDLLTRVDLVPAHLATTLGSIVR